MNVHTFGRVTGVIFLLVGLLHILRALQGWILTIGDFTVPSWFSVVVGIVLLYLSLQGFQLKK